MTRRKQYKAYCTSTTQGPGDCDSCAISMAELKNADMDSFVTPMSTGKLLTCSRRALRRAEGPDTPWMPPPPASWRAWVRRAAMRTVFAALLLSSLGASENGLGRSRRRSSRSRLEGAVEE
jgi:hypothetical protein